MPPLSNRGLRALVGVFMYSNSCEATLEDRRLGDRRKRMKSATQQRLESAIAEIDEYFVETGASHYSDSGTMWELAMNARGAIAEALAEAGVGTSDAPWAR
jgi:hypothetical protein